MIAKGSCAIGSAAVDLVVADLHVFDTTGDLFVDRRVGVERVPSREKPDLLAVRERQAVELKHLQGCSLAVIAQRMSRVAALPTGRPTRRFVSTPRPYASAVAPCTGRARRTTRRAACRKER